MIDNGGVELINEYRKRTQSTNRIDKVVVASHKNTIKRPLRHLKRLPPHPRVAHLLDIPLQPQISHPLDLLVPLLLLPSPQLRNSLLRLAILFLRPRDVDVDRTVIDKAADGFLRGGRRTVELEINVVGVGCGKVGVDDAEVGFVVQLALC